MPWQIELWGNHLAQIGALFKIFVVRDNQTAANFERC